MLWPLLKARGSLGDPSGKSGHVEFNCRRNNSGEKIQAVPRNSFDIPRRKKHNRFCMNNLNILIHLMTFRIRR